MTLFGTDGIRGRVGVPPLTVDCLKRISWHTAAALKVFEPDGGRVLIGRDSRASGPDFVAALAAGLASGGFEVEEIGCLPSPAVALLTHALGARLGLMVTASHNPHTDNGVKFFGPNGDKINDAVEAEISTRYLEGGSDMPSSATECRTLPDAASRYEGLLSASLDGLDLSRHKIVVDCAHGATSEIAPRLFRSLGAEVVEIGTAPDGHNINQNCGATDLSAVRQAIQDQTADFGLAFDGDGDRVLMVDGRGREISGDHMIAVLAQDLAMQGALPQMTAVATIMSNMGLERYLSSHNISLLRTAVGDRHVIAAMRANGYAVGGEQSGHIIIADHALTGDGIAAACRSLGAMHRLGLTVADVSDCLTLWPQKLKNLRLPDNVKAAEFMATTEVQACIASSSERLADCGRVNVRPSGTEPLLRIMVEAETAERVEAEIELLSLALTKFLQGNL